MAKFKKTLADGRVVEFDIASYEELTGSANFASRRRTITNKQRTPFQLQRGDQSQGFDIRDVSAPSTGAPVIIKLDEELNYVAMPKANYQTKLERELQAQISGASDRRGQVIPPRVFNSIKSQISTRITQLPSTIMILAEDTPFTGSYNITSGSAFGSISYSGIAGQTGYFDRVINNNSPTATGASWSFANSESTFVNGPNGNQFHQSQYTASFVIRTWASASHSGSHIFSSNFNNPFHSQSRVDSGKFYNYEYRTASSSGTGSVRNISTAGYYTTVLKANVFGDGNETKFAAGFAEPTSALYAQDRELLTFPYDTVVASGSFLWSFTFEPLAAPFSVGGADAPGAYKPFTPIKRVELYWASGSGGLILPGSPGAGLSGSISPNQIIPDSDTILGIPSGSHLFYDDKLSVPASGGYYTTAAKVTSGSLFNAPTADSTFNVGKFQSVHDRMFAGNLRPGAVIHIAGEGINEFGDPGQNFAQNPFKNAHESTSSKVIPAATRWNGQSFTLSKETGEINPGDYDDSGDN